MRRPIATALLLTVTALCLLLGSTGTASARQQATTSAVDGNGMWIWYVSHSSGGAINKIVAKARKHDVRTVYIKSSDGTDRWSQFSGRLVGALKRRGLKVCAWQFVYGDRPLSEAERGAEAARTGADCLVIDAEGQYEGKYVSAQSYMTRLRKRVGPKYEVALTSFPYVSYHPGFPYSVFLGPGGAQYNLPQMYWKTIGVSPDAIYRATWTYNRVYGRPIYPLGQTYENPSSASVQRFRSLATAYGARGLSWWVWQFAGERQWTALGNAFEPFGAPQATYDWPLLVRGNRSDLVVWAQLHLHKLKLLKKVDGVYGSTTQRAVRTFQTQSALPVTGKIDALTWQRLLPVGAAKVRWRYHRRGQVYASSARVSRVQPVPRNAQLPAHRHELRGKYRN